MTKLFLLRYAGLIDFNWSMLMVFITFLVLLLIMKKFFFEKIHNFMEEREKKVRTSFDNADAANEAAEKRLSEYEAKLKGANTERHEILSAAKNSADENSREIIAQAEKRAAAIIMQAQQEIELEKQRAAADMQKQIALLSIYAAERIIEKNLNAADQEAIIDRAIKEASEAQWKI
jgi:F-type H+-transporting ATPase subunit b